MARTLFRVMLVVLGIALAAPAALADTKPLAPRSGGSSPSGAKTSAPKPTAQDRGSTTVDTSKIDVAEPSTAAAIRGATAAPPAGPAERAGPAASAGPIASGEPVRPWSFRAGVLRGVRSPDSENAGGEHDPPFAAPALVAAGPAGGRIAPPPGHAYLSEMPNANDVATAAAERLGKQSIDVALLGLHKYMLADCLGVKVSVGEFVLKLGAPTIKIENASVVASYAIDKIGFSAFKLRFRPDVTDLAEPCHFSGRVELGGEADDVRLTFRYNPLIDVEHCTVGDPGRLDADLDIGHVNLGPVPPGIADLENPFKDMVGDALNGAFFAAESMAGVSGPVAGLLKEETKSLDEVLRDFCGNAYTQATKVVGDSAGAVTSSAATSANAAGGAPPGGLGPPPLDPCCSAAANPDLKGRLGRIVIAFPSAPKRVVARVEIRKAGGGPAVETGYGDTAAELLPGDYAVTVNGVEVPRVTVRSRFDTRVRVGVLHTQGSARTRFDVFAPGGRSAARSQYGESALGFPIGKLEVEVGGRRETVAIEEGRVADF